MRVLQSLLVINYRKLLFEFDPDYSRKARYLLQQCQMHLVRD
jgi:hypothetical protein